MQARWRAQSSSWVHSGLGAEKGGKGVHKTAKALFFFQVCVQTDCRAEGIQTEPLRRFGREKNNRHASTEDFYGKYVSKAISLRT